MFVVMAPTPNNRVETCNLGNRRSDKGKAEKSNTSSDDAKQNIISAVTGACREYLTATVCLALGIATSMGKSKNDVIEIEFVEREESPCPPLGENSPERAESLDPSP